MRLGETMLPIVCTKLVLSILKFADSKVCNADIKSDCSSARVTYELVCNLCPRDDDSNVVVPEGDGRSAVYRGQTAHTLHKRL